MNRRTIGLVVMLAAGAASSADLNGWQKKMPITFSGYSRAEALTNYPALVVLSTNLSGFSYADFLSTNADLRFTDSTQTNELSYEVDAWDTNGSSYVWVQVPLLTNSAVIQAFWGMNGQTAPAYTTNGTVWSQGFSGVYHFRQGSPAPDLRDSSPNAYHGLNSNTTSTATGRVGYAANFPGVDQFVTLTNGNKYLPIPNTPITVSTWFQVRGIGANNLDNRLFSIPRWYGSTGLGAGFGYTNKYQVFWNYGAGSEQYEVSIASNTWYHMALSFNGSQFTCYLNGNRWASSVNSLTNDIDSSLACIGSGPAASGAQPYNGIVDEFQISSVGRSSNWVWACYMSQASNNVFNTYGAAQPPSFPEITNIGSQNPSTASMEVVGRLITNGTSATTVTLYWSTTDGRTNAPDWTAGGSERDLGVQAAGAVFTNTLTGLASNTTYYWNHKAVNASGTVWAATAGSPSFSLFAVTGKTGTTTQVGDWSNSATWVSGYIPQGGDVAIVNHNIALSNSTPLLAAYTINAGKTNTFCTLNAALNAIQVNVYGTLTHTNNTATSTVGGLWIPNGRVVINCSNLLVETNGSINVDTLGYRGRESGAWGSGYGPGGGGGWGNGAGGGGYGGNGGVGVNSSGVQSSPAGPANGVSSAPDQPGSGGGNCGGGAAAGAGGGLIWIQATQGTVTVNGQISANGGYLSTPGSDRGGGGSGGGIYIACKTFAGTNGLLSVIGGIPQGWWPGGGGGGRIAVVVDPATQAGAPAVYVQFRCAGALGRDGGGNGASGTLYVNDSRVLPTVWNGRTASAVLLGFSSWSPAQLAITNAALSVGARLQLNVSSHLSLAGTTNSDALTLTNASSLICGGDLSISNTSLSLTPDVDSTPPTLTVNGNVSMVNTGRLYVYAAMTNSTSRTGAWVNVAGTMTLTKGSVVYPSGQPINGGSICFTVTNLNITDTTSGFDADGKGYWGAPANTSANGFGPGGGKFGTGGSAYAGGGGYGGLGGDGGSAPASGGGIYGVSNAPPVFAGSGGGNKSDGTLRAGDGGGLIWIEAGGTLTLNGYLKASGATPNPSVGERSGGGSGGGIYLKCRTLQGTTGSLTANGSVGRRWAGGGGGGGRIQVWSVTNQTSGLTASVQPGTGTDGGTTGAVGTVYWGTLPENDFSAPAISNGSSLNLANTSADVVGTLVSNGIPAAVVYLYWSTNNGMTNATAWTTGGSVSNLGSRAEGATFTNTLTDLTPNTTYFWTYSASNSVATAWAATNGSSFATRGPPGVNNAGGATDISQYGATLNGNLTNGGVASVSILLGTEDGVWSVTNNLGTTNHGPFSYTDGGLNLATLYYYTCYASNAYGTALASPSVVFTTRQGLVYYWVGASNANWSASSSWSTTSGGAAGAGVPGALDDAIFDAGGVSNALIDAAFAGTVYSVSVNAGYRGTITQSNSLTVAHDFSMSTGAWQFVTGCAGTLTVGGDMVVSNATIYCQRASAGGEGTGRVFTVGGNLTLGSGGRFDAREFGFAYTEGPGPGGYNRMGSHGGDGSRREATTYGSITQPVSLGGAGYDTYWGNRNGSGAIKLVVTGATVLAAGSLITVDGIDMAGNRPTSAGGSIFLKTATLSGTGTLSAKGGYDAVFDSAGGGRIAVWLASGTDFGGVTFAASGGAGTGPGAAGTIYLQTSAQSEGQGKLIVDNNNKLPQKATTMLLPGTALNGFSQVVIMNSGNIGIRTNIDFSQANIIGSGVGNAFVSIRSPASGLTIPTNISGNYTLNIDVPVTIPGDLTVATNARLSHTFNTTTSLYTLALTVVSNLTLAGPINVDGQGYTGGNGPSTTTIIENSAGHGGCGGGYAGTAAGGTYGSITNPVTLGSAGPLQVPWLNAGGGAIKLTAGGLLTVNAGSSISACAYTYAVNNFNGRGAGGSINITCASLAGSGSILADGSKSFDRCGGGGGRIAVYLTASDDFGALTIQARGGARGGSYTNGGAGTVYLKGASASYGTLIVDTTNAGPAAVTLISSNVTGAVVGDVIITNAAVLSLASNQTLTAYGHWMNRRTGVTGLSAGTNSTVILAGTNAGTVYGHTFFWNLTATNAGKVLTFEASKTNTVLGALILDNLTLLSTVDGAWWYLTQPTNAPQNIRAVIVKDSNASGGQTLYATRGDSLGHNINWWFPSKGSSFVFR